MLMAGKRDYYEVLGVAKDAGEDEIKRSFRKLAMQFHPDRNVGDKDAEEKFKEAAEAYDVLSDGNKRQRYDRYGHAGLEGTNGPRFHDARSAFEELFGGIFGDIFGQRGGHGGPHAGRDLQVGIEIDLLEAARGVSKTITIPREENCPECGGEGAKPGTRPVTCRRCGGRGAVIQGQGFFRIQQTCPGCGGRGAVITDPCDSCYGQGRVEVRRTLEVAIPPGVDNGNRIRLPGEGEAGEPGAPRGDLYCQVRVREHSIFERDASHLICRVPVTFSQAALGGPIEVPTLDGPITHNLPRGTQAGEVIRIAGRGMPSLRGGRPGDLLVQVLIETPQKLTKRQEELFRELAEIDQKHVSPQRKSFMDKLRDLIAGDPPDAKAKQGQN
jgi:molecular chaperone DnaJ